MALYKSGMADKKSGFHSFTLRKIRLIRKIIKHHNVPKPTKIYIIDTLLLWNVFKTVRAFMRRRNEGQLYNILYDSRALNISLDEVTFNQDATCNQGI